MSSPDLSVVIPLYNRAHTIGATLHSLFGSEIGGLDVVVVDDGSSDDSCALVEMMIDRAPPGISVRLERQANAGPGAARNTGARLSRGDWVAFLDSDDLWMPWTARVITQARKERPSCSALLLRTTMFQHEDDLATVRQTETAAIWHATMLDMRLAPNRLKQYGSCNLAMRRQSFFDLGGFTDRTRCGEDIDLLCRAGGMGPVGSITAPVMVGFRNGGTDSLGRDMSGVLKGSMFLLSREKSGAYHGCGPDAPRRRALCDSLIFTTNRFFQMGHPALAYRLWAQSVAFLVANARAGRALKLGLTPILSVLRPHHYRFRLRPIGANGREPGFDTVNDG